MDAKIQEIIEKYNNDKSRLMDILIDIQSEIGYISKESVIQIAKQIDISHVDVEQTMSFYHFFTQSPPGKYSIFLNNSVVADMMGREGVRASFEKEAGCKFGEITEDGLIGRFDTACIGMNDQEPAAIINNIVFTKLTPFRVREIIRDIKAGKSVSDLFMESYYGGGMNSSDKLRAMVTNNIRKVGPVLSRNYVSGAVIKEKLPQMSAEDVINEVKDSGIRGRGGAGFPTGLKWEFCRKAKGDKHYILCNADEGEPGTFKDRVILTEFPELLFEGMAVAAYAIGANEGLLYLRYEYKYMEDYLEDVLHKARANNLLGKNIGGITGFDFDIRIQFGAGAYVCGEESALIESAEGKRGEPRDRPPFPVEKGYLDQPTVINNVETLITAVKILNFGSEWYKSFGTEDSTGTKVLSISGDCKFPGIYEVEWGFSVRDMLDMVGASEVQAVQVGGPSGSLISPKDFDRVLCYSDLSTGGSMIIIGDHRDILKDIVLNFMEFFIDESCGSCSTCREIPVIMTEKLKNIMNGKGIAKDIDDLLEWGELLKVSRCGLGHTAGNPILSSIKNFRHIYDEKVIRDLDYISEFDLKKATKESCDYVGRIPSI
ncbi:MAG: NAD(P)H-dependent oxidoreductase subunit E [Bacteroidales bacterium]|nr:NAD(P)H-dependent oxidoreductase subunit E [Bacteroidales bacterium]